MDLPRPNGPWPDPKGRDFSYLTQLRWPSPDRFAIEAWMIKNGGRYKGHGEGLAHHYKAAIAALWPEFQWHRWSHLLIQGYSEWGEVAVQGPASSGKTFCSAAFCLVNFFVWPIGTSIIMSSTTKDGLEFRVWGAVKELYTDAKKRRDYLPGYMIQSRTCLSGVPIDEDVRDFRHGIIGVACRVGGQWVGISNYVGIKNERIILCADEASLMGSGFIDSLSNLRKGAPSFRFICMGNPKDQTDALGRAAEPSAEVGGWDGYDSAPRTQTWKTRAPNGIAIQLCGLDSPNYDAAPGANPWKGIITPEAIEADRNYYGEESLNFSMMNLGVMPRGGSARRVLTTLLVEQRQGFEGVIWDGQTTRGAGLDAAYSGVGGDRCVLTPFEFGLDRDGTEVLKTEQQIIVPINPALKDTPEDQITAFCRKYCESHGIPPSHFGLDSTGRGSLVSSLAKNWSPDVIAIEFGGRPPERPVFESNPPLDADGNPKLERDVYGKMVSALWFASRNAVEARQLRGLSREAVEEASMREWGIGKGFGGRSKDPLTDVEPKDKMKARMGRSPDLWDSVVVAVEVARRLGFKLRGNGGAGRSSRGQQLPEWLRRQAESVRNSIRQGTLRPV